jgi:hypothetical protein
MNQGTNGGSRIANGGESTHPWKNGLMEECPMADVKNARFIVKHVDGVMHLIPNPNGQVVGEVPHLRTLPPVVEPVAPHQN